MPIPPTLRLFPDLRSDLRAAGLTRRTPNVHFRDVGRFREFVQFQRDHYSTPTRTGVLINVAAIDRHLWTRKREERGDGWMSADPDSPDYGELDSGEFGWRDRPESDFFYFDSEALQEADLARVRSLLADGIAMLEQRRVPEWTPFRRPFSGRP